MDARNVLHGNGEEAIGVSIPHILLDHEGELGEVLQAREVLRVHACLIEALLEEVDVVVGVAYAPSHAL